MPQHAVRITHMPDTLIGKSDVWFEVKKDNSKLGDLRVSQGNVFWLPVGCEIGYYMPWIKFDEIMQGQGKRRRYSY